jgi:hypothetical protein
MLHKKNIVQSLLVAFFICATLSSCAHTKIMNTWRDPGYEGTPKRVLVHMIARNPTAKAMLENQFVEQLEKHGMVAFASYNYLADQLFIDKEAIKKLAVEKQIDTLLVGAPTNRKDLESLRPGQMSYGTAVYQNTDEDFYAAVSAYTYQPGTYAQEEVASEIVVFDVKTRRRVWTALAKTFISNTKAQEIAPAVKQIMELLVRDKIVPAPGGTGSGSGR